MAELTIGLTYGNALYQAAKEVNKRDLILEQATEVLEIIKQEPDLHMFMDTPVVSAAEKKKALGAIFEGRICDELLNLIYIMVDKGRTRHFPRIVRVYRDLLNHEEGFSYGKIFTVKPLSPDRLTKFEGETGKLLQQNVRLENEIDPALIGGIKIFIDGKIIDASLQRRLEDLGNTIL